MLFRSSHEPVTDPAETEARLADRQTEEHDLGISPELQRALERLGPRERELIALRYGADMTTIQIAELTELSVVNVQQILSRSLRRLRDELEASGLSRSAGDAATGRRG